MIDTASILFSQAKIRTMENYYKSHVIMSIVDTTIKTNWCWGKPTLSHYFIQRYYLNLKFFFSHNVSLFFAPHRMPNTRNLLIISQVMEFSCRIFIYTHTHTHLLCILSLSYSWKTFHFVVYMFYKYSRLGEYFFFGMILLGI